MRPELRNASLRLVYRVWLAVVVGLVLVYARWWAWYGGASWGPRFFLFACLPAALVLARWTTRAAAHSTWANVFVLGAVALSCWVGANGIVFQGHGSERYWLNNFELESLTWYVPECSVLWLPFVVPKALGWEEYARLAAFALAFAYLAWPVVRALAPHIWSACAAAVAQRPRRPALAVLTAVDAGRSLRDRKHAAGKPFRTTPASIRSRSDRTTSTVRTIPTAHSFPSGGAPMYRSVIAMAVVALTAGASQAAIVTKTVDYEFDGVKLKGFLAYDDAAKEKRPGVLVVHEWWGLDEYAKDRCNGAGAAWLHRVRPGYVW